MRTRKFILKLGAAALTCATFALAGNPALAIEYWLRAEPTFLAMPDGSVAMWGYSRCESGFTNCGPASVPGPGLAVPPGEAALTVHLQNALPVATSLVINGLIKPMTPVWDDGSSGNRTSLSQRVRSFDAEAAANGTQDYTWPSVAPGTYLYQSGTQPQVQVQMGLYGAVTKNVVDTAAATTTAAAVAGQAYPGTGYAFDNEATLVYSEIDPALHAAVAADDYGPAKGTTSTINYAPKYFLINGKPYQFGAPVIEPVGSPGITRLRLLNAGLTTHVPMIKGTHWDAIAEDGKPYPYRKTQYTALLTAAKTMDVLLTPEIGATYAIVDRRLSLSNNGVADGGMLAFLRVSTLGGGVGAAAPIANPDTYTSVRGVTLNVAATGVLGNDSDPNGALIKVVATSGKTAGDGTNRGTYSVNANGSFTYVPSQGFTGPSDSFTYQATNGQAVSAPATVTISLTTPVAPGLSALDGFDRADSPSLGAAWNQQTSTTTGADLGISGNAAIANGTALGGLAIWGPTTFGNSQGASFTPGGTPNSNVYLVLKATGGTLPGAPANYIRVGCEVGQAVVSTMSGGSNVSAYVKQASFGACGGQPMSAVVDAKGLVTVFVNGAFAGGVQLPDVSVWKGGGKIGIQMTTLGATADNFAGGNVP